MITEISKEKNGRIRVNMCIAAPGKVIKIEGKKALVQYPGRKNKNRQFCLGPNGINCERSNKSRIPLCPKRLEEKLIYFNPFFSALKQRRAQLWRAGEIEIGKFLRTSSFFSFLIFVIGIFLICSVKRDAEALEMAQPSPSKATSVSFPPLIFPVSLILSPQVGLICDTSISDFLSLP
jgi:hypothetical protein